MRNIITRLPVLLLTALLFLSGCQTTDLPERSAVSQSPRVEFQFEGGEFFEPAILSQIEPVYPEDMKRRGMEGPVLVEFQISEEGIPTGIEVLSSVNAAFIEPVEDALAAWRFQPVADTEGLGPTKVRLNCRFYLHDWAGIKLDELADLAKAGDLAAMQHYAGYHMKGAYTESAYKEAIRWYQRGAAGGNPKAMFNLAIAHRKGNGLEKSEAMATTWFEKAARAGDAEGMFNLGTAYVYGRGVQKDFEKAMYWYKRAAEAGSPGGNLNLGLAYQRGQLIGRDNERAAFYFEKAARGGEATAMLHLARFYKNGTGVEQDLEQAVYWFNKMSEQGDPRGLYNIGLLYRDGEHFPQDYEAAYDWILRAAGMKHARASFDLATLFRQGKGTDKNGKMAFRWFLKAAEAGDPRATMAVWNARPVLEEQFHELVGAEDWSELIEVLGLSEATEFTPLPEPGLNHQQHTEMMELAGRLFEDL